SPMKIQAVGRRDAANASTRGATRGGTRGATRGGTRGGRLPGRVTRDQPGPTQEQEASLYPSRPDGSKPQAGDWSFTLSWTITLIRPEDARQVEESADSDQPQPDGSDSPEVQANINADRKKESS
ncbi:MAG: hypothetical protein R3336_01420, partial [Phycisphaeraceae bacterium]|nr:hypothetical protein [Phycisphaeraceae bacterium]